MMRVVIFGYDLLVVFVLAVVALLYFKFAGTQPSDGWLTLLQHYQLPLKCLWFGALGGVVISLKGVYEHPVSASSGWSDDFNLWHFGRPVSGAITGVITFVLLHVINPSADPSAPVLYAAAFILGTQEARFFNFLYEVGRIIVQVPEQKPAGLKVTDVQPSKGTAGKVLVVAGQGFVPGVTVTLDGAALTSLSVASDGAAVAGIIPAGTAGKTVDLVVTNPDGTTVTLHNKFTYA